MTVNDESSIYVGGLPYTVTEDRLRRIFDIYGDIVAVKIINDRTVGGKCYGFVTFANPRSAMHAINEMDGKTVDGRPVRVNEVTTRGGRSSFGRERFRRDSGRGIDSVRGRDRDRDRDDDRDRYQNAHRDRSRDHDRDRERGYDQLDDHEQARDRFSDRVRDHSRERVDARQHRGRSHERDWERYRDREMEIENTNINNGSEDKDKDKMTAVLNGRSDLNGRGNRELSAESIDHDQVEKQLEIANQKLEELQKEISQMEESAEEKQQLVSKLLEKSQKLDGSLTAAKKLTSTRQMQLAKLHRCYLQVRDLNEGLKSCEQELQSVVHSSMTELELGDAAGTRSGS